MISMARGRSRRSAAVRHDLVLAKAGEWHHTPVLRARPSPPVRQHRIADVDHARAEPFGFPALVTGNCGGVGRPQRAITSFRPSTLLRTIEVAHGSRTPGPQIVVAIRGLHELEIGCGLFAALCDHVVADLLVVREAV